MQDSPSFAEVHSTLLERYISLSASNPETSDADLVTLVRHIKRSYLPTAHTYSHLFALLIPVPAANQAVSEVYHHWTVLDPVESSVAYAAWLLKTGRASEAVGVVQGVRGEEAKEEVGRRWREVLDANDRERVAAKEDDGDEVMEVEA